MKAKKTIIFCANEQVETEQTISVDSNGEWVFTCDTCGRVLKFSSNLSAQEVKDLLSVHKEANEGQVTKKSINKKIKEFTELESSEEEEAKEEIKE